MDIEIHPFDPNLRTTPIQGVYRTTMAEYLSIKALSRTVLFEMEQTPAHALLKLNEPDEPTAATDFGTAFHTTMLEAPNARSILVAEEGVTRAQKAWRDVQNAARGRTPITTPEAQTLWAMRRRMLAEPGMDRLLASPYRELTLVWRHDATGIWCKARLDILDTSEASFILDLKTAKETDPRRFAYSCRDYGYTLPAGMYLAGCDAVFGEARVKGFFIAAIEKEPPYRMEWYDMVRHVAEGRKRFEVLIRNFAECQAANVWPAMNRLPHQPPTLHELPL